MRDPIPGRTPLHCARMFAPRPPRDRERGNSLLLALIVMSALATLGSLTVVSTQSNLKTATNNRAQTIALYAAESGAAVAMDFLRNHFDPATPNAYSDWSAYLMQGNQNVVPVSTANIPSNDALPGSPNNLFSPDQNAWFDIQLYNNRNDPLFNANNGQCDGDGRLIIRVTGRGPQGSVAIVEWEVQRTDYTRGWLAPWGIYPPGSFGPDGFLVAPAGTLPPAPPVFPGWNNFTPPVAPGMVLIGWHIVSL